MYFKYVLFHNHQLFFAPLIYQPTGLIIYTYLFNIYYLALHIKLSSVFYSTQLIDLFVYELPSSLNISKNFDTISTNKIPEPYNSLSFSSVSVYNFHNFMNQTRFFFFCLNTTSSLIIKSYSIAELFLNANWLEREAAELHGIFFYGKKDLRNLLLPYGDNSTPMIKSFPSIGTREIFYDIITDTVIQNPISLQF